MPSAFKSTVVIGVGTVAVTAYTAPALTTTTVIGFSVANTTAADITVSVTVMKGSTTAFLVKGAVIPFGGALVVVGGDQKLVLETSDKVSVTSSVAGSADAVVSVLELS